MDFEDKFRKLRKESREDVQSFATLMNSTDETLDTPSIEKVKSEPEVEPKKSEREELLAGLKELTQEKIKTTGSPVKFPGGEVDIINEEGDSLETVELEALEPCPELDVLFVYNYSSDALALAPDRRDEAPSEQLLKRMIKAMKVPDDKYQLLVIEEDQKEVFHKKLSEIKTKIVVPMGAVATNLVLGKQERISKIHGSFFSKEIQYKNDQVRSFQVVPVFNTEMILINPNMKRSTWLDLQGIMKNLGISTD